MAISNAFKSAYTNQVAQQNQGINTITSGVKDLATAAIGAAGFAGALGSGAAATAAKHTLAGRIGGVGGNIMLSTLQEKKDSANAKQANSQLFSVEDITNTISSQLGGNPINNSAIKQLGTVFETLQQAKEQNLLNKKGTIDSSIGEIDPNSDLGKKIIQGLEKKNNNIKQNTTDYKQKQLDIILKTNPAQDDYHTWIRTKEDIKTLNEAIQYSIENDGTDEDNPSTYPDVSGKTFSDALKSGKIMVYSSKPISNGNFVTPSKMNAQSYAGNGKIYSSIVNINDIAWINADEGQFAKYNEEDK